MGRKQRQIEVECCERVNFINIKYSNSKSDNVNMSLELFAVVNQ